MDKERAQDAVAQGILWTVKGIGIAALGFLAWLNPWPACVLATAGTVALVVIWAMDRVEQKRRREWL